MDTDEQLMPSAYDLIRGERKRQISWNGDGMFERAAEHDDAHTCGSWMLYIAKQHGHVAQALQEFDEAPTDSEALRFRLRQIIKEATQNAAVLVALVESCQRDLARLSHDTDEQPS